MSPSAEDLACSSCGSTRRARTRSQGLVCADCGAELEDDRERARPRPATSDASTSPAEALDVPDRVVAMAAGRIREAQQAGLDADVGDDAWVAAALVDVSEEVDVDEAAAEAGVDVEAVRRRLDALRDALG